MSKSIFPEKPSFAGAIPSLVVFLVLCCSLYSQANEKNTQHIRPAWSPSGKFFAYLSNEKGSYQLYISEFKTLTSICITDLTSDITQFKWSPKEDQLLFLSGKGLFTINRDGSNSKLVHAKQDVTPFFFDWKPDGKGISYSCPSPENFVKICTKDLSSGNVIQLTTGRYDDRNFHWSTDGRELAFGSNKNGKFEIYTMDTKSGETKKHSLLPNNSIDPVFSRDGKLLTFIHDGDGNNTNFDVYLVDKSVGQKVICSCKGYNLPLWHPDGKQLLINSNGNGFWEIYTYKLESSILTKLSDGLAFSVSPDGLYILVQSNKDKGSSICLLDFQGNKKSLSELIISN
ncbi:hypothetical protein [Ulvibacterium sp.]|uniref:TolB family protein n=1 Tax=Ulvibacterium sp. TaxID=2665914 RepID=UPI003BAAE22A